jgi:hypothetical protein
MGLAADLKMYARFALGLRGFLRHTMTLEEARAIVQRRLEERESNFLRMVEKGIYGYPRSPYLPLLRLAGAEAGDIKNMARNKGLEDTLRALKEEGVYVTFEEYKGREHMVRSGKLLPVQPRDFDNPYLSHYFQAESGGTTGAGTRVDIDLDHLAAGSPYMMATYDAHGILNMPTAIWNGILPDSSGIVGALLRSSIGQVPQKWFSPIPPGDVKTSLKDRLATRYIVNMGRLFGVRLPRPEPVSVTQAIQVARWAADTLKVHGTCLIVAHVSKALRVSLEAREEGLDLTGAVFWLVGEPPTPAKVKQITKAGARFISSYPFTETGYIGTGCARPVDENDIHFFRDRLVLTQHPRQVPGTKTPVDAFYFTTLLPSAPKILLNVESDDYGTMERRSCGCPLEGWGFTEHLRHIRSFRKLTGEGVTLVGSEMVNILEEVLPARFGGSPLDYQLLEEEDENGFTRLSLLINPRIEIKDEREVIETVMEALKRSSVAADLARSIWDQAGTLRVKRAEPILTTRGKLMPLHLQRSPKEHRS